MSSILSRFMQLAGVAGEGAGPVAGSTPAVAAEAAVASSQRAPTLRAGPVAGPDMLLEEQIDTARLLSLFKQAYMDVQAVEGGRLRVVSDFNIVLLVNVDAERKLIFFSALFRTKTESTAAARVAFANRANDKLVLARWVVLENGALYADYQLPYEGALPSALVVGLTRRLGRVMAQAMSELDSDGVIG